MDELRQRRVRDLEAQLGFVSAEVRALAGLLSAACAGHNGADVRVLAEKLAARNKHLVDTYMRLLATDLRNSDLRERMSL